MRLPEPIRELGQLQTSLRVKDLQHFEQLTWRQKRYDAHAYTKTIFLRHWDRDRMTPRKFPFVIKDFPLLADYRKPLQAILSDLGDFYQWVDYAAMITSLKPGCGISSHCDRGCYFENSHRVHIPLKTNLRATFDCGHRTIHMELDHAYEIGNVNHTHAVRNHGEQDRHHLIVDLIQRLE